MSIRTLGIVFTAVLFSSLSGPLQAAPISTPAVTSISRLNPGPLTTASSVTWHVAFNKPVTGVNLSDFVLTQVNGSASGTLSSLSGSDRDYVVTASSLAGLGTLRLDLKTGATDIVDASANTVSSGFFAGQPYVRIRASVPLTWGYNDVGQLGNNSTTNRASPSYMVTSGVLAGKTLVAASRGRSHDLVLASDGSLFSWGWNYYGQLGNNSTTNSSVPVTVDRSGVLSGKTVISISAGFYHSMALCSDGTVAAWGQNSFGQLGNNSTTGSSVPVAVNTTGALAGKTVVAIAAGEYHSLALCSDGTVVAWGYNSDGQLGNSSTADSSIPVAVNTTGVLAGKTVVAIAAGEIHSLALCSDGTVVAWGANAFGELGNNSTTDSYVPVAVDTTGVLAGKTVVTLAGGDTFSQALCNDGFVAAWGYNAANELGDNSTVNCSTPEAVNTTEGISALAGRSVSFIATGCNANHNVILASPISIASLSTPPAGSVSAGTVLSFTLNLSAATTVNTAGGTPRLALTIGSSPVYASYVSGSGTHSLAFSYTVQAGDTNSSVAIASTAIDLNGSTLLDGGGYPIDPTLPSLSLPAIFVDTTAPDTAITSNPAAQSSSKNASFAFTGVDAGGSGVASYQVSLDGGSYITATSPCTYSGLADGSHTFQVRAVDAAGNIDPTPASYTWTVDSTAPDAPAVTAVGVNSITGSAEPNSTVTVYVDGVAVGTAVANASGVWTLTVSLTAGSTPVFTATATDSVGNVSTLSAGYSATLRESGNTWVVTTNSDTVPVPLPGSLRFALLHFSSGDTIQFDLDPASSTILLASALPPITHDIVIDGGTLGAVTIDGAGAYRVFFVDTGDVQLKNLKIQNALAQGGDGGIGDGGGGGGAGLGAGLFVNQASANVTVTNVDFVSMRAVGGAGGRFASRSYPGGGGGGMTFRGGNSTANTGGPGGGGMLAPGVDLTSGLNGTSGGAGGGGGGGGLGSGLPGLGGSAYAGNDAGSNGVGTTPGRGGFGGGGGGGALATGGDGGFGGGGGGSGTGMIGGAGGPGAGGGGSDGFSTAAAGGSLGSGISGGASGVGTGSGGGGGAAAGPAIFVRLGSLTTVNSAWDTASAQGGAGGTGLSTHDGSAGNADATPVFNYAGTVNSSSVTGPVATALIPCVPVLNAVALRSSGPSVSLAKAGDTITLSFSANRPLAAPTIILGGHSITALSAGGNAWTASVTVDASDTDGPVVFSIAFAAIDGFAGTTVSSTSDGSTVTIDKTAPAAPVTPSTAITTTNNSLPEISGTAEPGSTVNVYVDGVLATTTTADGSGNWSFTFGAPLPDGSHAITVTASDTAGNVSNPSTALNLTVDTVAPATPAAPGLASASDSGRSATDHLTNVAKPTLSGTAESGSTVALFDGATPVASVTADNSGTWSYTFATALTEGTHAFSVTATDAAKNTSGHSSVLSVVVDTTAPAAPVFSTASGNTTNATPVLNGTAEPGSLIALRDNSAALATVTANAAGEWSFSVTAALADGTHPITATATDAAGNTSPAAALTLVKGTAPVITTQPSTQTATLGLPAAFTVAATGTETLTYTWQQSTDNVSFVTLSSGTTAGYSLASTTLANAGYYRVIVSNDFGSATSASALLTVPSAFPAAKPDGYASAATGGAGGNTVVVLTATDFKAQASSANACTITVVGQLSIGTVNVASNKTIQGADANATLLGSLNLTGVSNVIVRGLHLTNPGTTIVSGAYTDGGSALTISGSNRIFVTHCSFFDCADHQIKILSGSDTVTVSWCEFYTSSASLLHRCSVQIGAAGDTALQHVTLHHNWWTASLDQRLPYLSYGYVHQYNNCVDASGDTSGTVLADQAQLLSERNVYSGVNAPLAKTSASARARVIGNTYTGCTGTPDAGTDTVFTPAYSYEMQPVSEIAATVAARAGNTDGASYSDDATHSASITGPVAAVARYTSFALTAVPAGFTPTSYQWRLNNTDIPGATSSVYTVGDAQAGDSAAGTYTVVLGTPTGEAVVSTPCSVTIDDTIKVGTVRVSGGGAPSWEFLGALALLAGLRHLAKRSQRQ